MSSQAPELTDSQAAEILTSFASHSAPAAGKSIRYSAALPSPSSSVKKDDTTFASARKSTADDTYGCTSPSKTLPTPRSSRRSTWYCQSPTADKEVTPNHASSDDSTDDEEGAATTTTTTTARDITCHGNTYLNLVPHAGSACWELARQTDPASTGVQPASRPPTLSDHNGESACPRCRTFHRSRTAAFARRSRETTVALTADAQDCLEHRRTGAAAYADADHETLRYKLRSDQLKQRRRYIAFHALQPETRVRWQAARLERLREAPYERAYAEMRRNRDAETARIRAKNKAAYERAKAVAGVKPRVSFARYIASLPTPGP